MNLSVRAGTLPELFEKVSYTYFDALLPLEDVGEAIREKVVAEAKTPEALLSAWLKSLVNLTLVDGMVFREVRILALKAEKDQPCQIRAEAVGELLDPARHVFRLDRSKLNKLRVLYEKHPTEFFAQIIFPEKP